MEMALARDLLVPLNTRIRKLLRFCTISVPMPRGNGLRGGLMLIARNGQARKLLRITAGLCECRIWVIRYRSSGAENRFMSAMPRKRRLAVRASSVAMG
jgi:Asp-tRNA(Asn)/Glu-tRNA(Gln) amidotransferase A subunit family amidase